MNLAVVVVAAIAATCVVGCSSPSLALPQGRRMIMATYSAGELTATLPEQARVQAVGAAAEETMRARAYSIRYAEATEEMGRVVALPPNSSGFPRVTVISRRAANGTNVSIEYAPWGDEATCRSVLDGILERLGL
jgi:hypothetical protein